MPASHFYLASPPARSSSSLSTTATSVAMMTEEQKEDALCPSIRPATQPPTKFPSRHGSMGLVQISSVSSMNRPDFSPGAASPIQPTINEECATVLSSKPVPRDDDADGEMQSRRRSPFPTIKETVQLPTAPLVTPPKSDEENGSVVVPLVSGISQPPLVSASNDNCDTTSKTLKSPKTKQTKKKLKSLKGTKSPKKNGSTKKKATAAGGVNSESPLVASEGDEKIKSPKTPRQRKKKASTAGKSPRKKSPTNSQPKKCPNNTTGTGKRKAKKRIPLDPVKIQSKLDKVETLMSKMVKKQGDEEAFRSERFEVLLERQEKYQRQLKRCQAKDATVEIKPPKKSFSVLLQRYRTAKAKKKESTTSTATTAGSTTTTDDNHDTDPNNDLINDDTVHAGNNRRSLAITKMKSSRGMHEASFRTTTAPAPLPKGSDALKSFRGGMKNMFTRRSSRTLKPKRSDKVAAPRLKELEGLYRPKVFDKTPEDIAIIKQVLARNFVFKKVKDLALEQLLRAFEPLDSYQKGDIIIEREQIGNYFYILGPHGRVEFEDADGNKTKEADQPGTAFGVLAVLYRNPSRVTVRVSSETSRIYRVDQVTFRYILQSRSKAKALAMQAVTKVKAVNRLLSLLDTAATERRLKSKQLSLVISDDEKEETLQELNEEEEAEEEDESINSEEEDEPEQQEQEEADSKLAPLSKRQESLLPYDEERRELVKEDHETSPKNDEPEPGDEAVPVAPAVTTAAAATTTCSDEKEPQETSDSEMAGIDPSSPIKIITNFDESVRSDLGFDESTDDLSLALDDISASGFDDYLETPDAEYSKFIKELDESRTSLKKTIIGNGRDMGGKDVNVDMFHKMSVLGEGQFGEVWLVQPKVKEIGEKMFALKIQSKEDMTAHSAEYSVEEAIRRECRVLDHLCHPFIVDFVHSFEDPDNIYLIMSLIRGVELWNCIHREQDDGRWTSGLQEDHCKFYALLIADTLNYMHRQKFCHRDIKPENVMIDHTGYPVLVDFGFAKELPSENGKTFTMCGTPKYTAPEVIANEGHGCPVDHWALGIVIYEMMSGENPFWYEGITDLQLLEDIVNAAPYPIQCDEGECSDVCLDLISQLLDKDPENRLMGNNVTSHPWFDSIDLNKARRMEVRAPWAPDCSAGLMPNSPVVFS